MNKLEATKKLTIRQFFFLSYTISSLNY